VVNQDGTFFHTGKGAIGTQNHSAQIVIVANAAKNNVSIFDGFTGRGGMRWLLGVGKLLAPGRRLGCAAVVNRDRVARTRQVSSHGVAHDAKAQKGDVL
jgi:hypothetical protein